VRLPIRQDLQDHQLSGKNARGLAPEMWSTVDGRFPEHMSCVLNV
jgi:hypothetical protein